MSSPEKRKKKTNRDFWRACRFFGPYRRIVAISMTCAVLAGFIMTSGIGALFPILQVLTKGDTVQAWVGRMVASHQPHVPWYLNLASQVAGLLPLNPVGTIAVLFIAIAVLGLIGNVFRFFQEYLSDKAAISAVQDIRKTLYDHVLHIPLEFFGMQGTSDVTSRLVQDCQGLQEGFKLLLGQGVQEPIKAGMALALAMCINWQLTVFIIACTPVMAVIMKKFGKKMRRASRAALQSNSEMLGQIEGSLAGVRVVKAANAERLERRRYVNIMAGLHREQLKMARYEALSTPALETVAMWIAGAVLIFASYLMFVKHTLDSNKFFVVMTCLISIGESLRRLGKMNSVIQRSSAAASRVFETMDVPVERPRLQATRRSAGSLNGHLLSLPPIQRELRFEGITFSYPNSPAAAVSNVDLTVPKGKAIAIVGRNGSGKTTLLALVPRFYDPDAGRITIDGTDIRQATLRSLRRQISIVTQDSVIFPGTIAQNIAYGHPLATKLNDGTPSALLLRDQIESAAKRAFAHEFIMEKSQGYDAPLDGLGGQLSGGQKQRLNIARAILRQSPILILDEATSQVDAESEHLIQQAIESLMHERTTFVIAHRFSTILSADSIVVMERGRIVGQGKHEELLRTCETYQQLYERQMITASA